MSLLLGARGKDFVVLLADGISLRKTDEKTLVEHLDLKKLFQVGERPCVIAHHGQNELGGLPVESVLTNPSFLKLQGRAWNQGLNVTMARSVERLDSVVCQTLKSSPHRNLFGLWFAGFWPCTTNPEISELIWQHSGHNRVRTTMMPHKHLVMGGGGIKYLRDFLSKPINKEFDASKIATSPAEYAMELVKKLYTIAEKRQQEAGEKTFGGERTMALITRDGVDLGPLN
jgi:hypothetical protein